MESITGYLDITLFTYEKEDYRSECLKVVDQLCNLENKLSIPFGPYGVYNFSIEYLNKDDSKKEELLKSIQEKKVIYIENTSNFLNSNLIKIQLKDIEISSRVPGKLKEEWKEIDFNMFDLKEIANRLSNSLRTEGLVSRFGGDEFIVVGLEYDENKAHRFIRRFIEELDRFNQSGNHEFSVYVSYG